MIIYEKHGPNYKKLEYKPGMEVSEKPVWIDILNMTNEEEKFVENLLNIDVPSKEEEMTIELSNRLYYKYNSVYMTISLINKSESGEYQMQDCIFILTESTLVTVRYCDPLSFKNVLATLAPDPHVKNHSLHTFSKLIDEIINNIASAMETRANNIKEMTRNVFSQNNDEQKKQMDLSATIINIGTENEKISQYGESMVSLSRMISFILQSPVIKLEESIRSELKVHSSDISALNDYAAFLSDKIDFLLSATLGLINLQQNNIIKMFSAATMIFLTPTLIASIYGMNFSFMPELNWWFGYPLSLLLMILTSVIPYGYFKTKKWL
ncbi:MAG: CorA family divalent cation transporter [Rickettsiaceae bacterium]|nr:CorA family divalent cation transporter [Rickettsiaceae bacterium]